MSTFADIGYEAQSGPLDQRLAVQALIIRIGREDDALAVTQLYAATERVVYAYILSIIQNPEDTADLVQETYIYVRRSAHLYIPTGKPLAWMLSIARKLANDYIRVHKHMPPRNQDTAYDGITEITDRIIFKHALEILHAEERQVLFLHAAAGLRYREIAAYLFIPISSVRTRYRRVADKLKKQLYPLGVSL